MPSTHHPYSHEHSTPYHRASLFWATLSLSLFTRFSFSPACFLLLRTFMNPPTNISPYWSYPPPSFVLPSCCIQLTVIHCTKVRGIKWRGLSRRNPLIGVLYFLHFFPDCETFTHNIVPCFHLCLPPPIIWTPTNPHYLYFSSASCFSSTSLQFSPRNCARHSARVHRREERKKSKKNQNRTKKNKKKTKTRMVLSCGLLNNSRRKFNRMFSEFPSHHETRFIGENLHRQINRNTHSLLLFLSVRKGTNAGQDFEIRSVP